MGDDTIRHYAVKHSRHAACSRKMVAQQPPQTLRFVISGHNRRHIPRNERHGAGAAPSDALRLPALHHIAGLALHRDGRNTHRRQRGRNSRRQCLNTLQRLRLSILHGDHRGRNAAHTPAYRDQQAPHAQNSHNPVLHSLGRQLRRHTHSTGRPAAIPALPARRRLLLVHEPAAAMALHGRPAHTNILHHRQVLLRQGTGR